MVPLCYTNQRLGPVLMRLTLAALALAVMTAACSGSAVQRGAQERAQRPCGSIPAPVALSDLPGGFPQLDGVSYTGVVKAGPSEIVSGFSTMGLAELFASVKAQMARAPYTVVKSEQEAHDAEVNFSGSGTSGQVRLQDDCEGRRAVRITIRPFE